MSATALLAIVLAIPAGVSTGKYFKITVVDAQTGRGVPLVELRTVSDIRYFTDSNGVIAFYEPGLMNRRVFFHVQSHGYEFPKNGFGFRGKALLIAGGGSAELKINRINVAQRLYRVTGAGIYRDSVLTGTAVPTRQPVLNGLVLGSDSVVNTVYHGRIFWFWGDTNRPGYPLGNFHVPGATSLLPAGGGLDPDKGVDLEYFVDDNGFAKPAARMPGEGPTWIGGLVAVDDEAGRERLFAGYVKVRKFLEVYQRGLVEFSDEKKQFEKAAQFDMAAPLFPQGHPLKHADEGVEYVYFATPYPLVRVRARAGDLKDLTRYEAYTCLKAGTRLDEPQLDRSADGTLRYAWKKDTPPVGPAEQANLIKQGKLRPAEALLHLQDADTGKAVTAHGGSVYFNAFRNRWVMIAVESGGTSMLGEVWYAEADTPLGPWVYARKVVTHEKYSFYNPKQHPMFDKHNGREIFFEGTYTALFSGNPDRTPRYNYNQIMYKLDLADPRLALPVAVYQTGRQGSVRLATRGEFGSDRIAFFAPDRPGAPTVPVYTSEDRSGLARLHVAEAAVVGSRPEFYALRPSTLHAPKTTVPLYEFVHDDGRHVYTTDSHWSAPEYRRNELPICLVWRNPMK